MTSLQTDLVFSFSQRVLQRKEDMPKALFQHTDVSGRVRLAGPLEQPTWSSHSTLVTFAYSLPGTRGLPFHSRVTAPRLRSVYLSSS